MKLKLAEYLKNEIPITIAFGFQVVDASAAQVLLHVPLSPNTNHKGTAFGGSLFSATTISAWGLVYNFVRSENITGDIVLKSSTMEFLKPVEADFDSICKDPGAAAWEKLKLMHSKKSVGKIELKSQIISRAKICAEFTGIFVVKR